jgi:anti-sigma28 factor (negative regulator of flagellin synthesis)
MRVEDRLTADAARLNAATETQGAREVSSRAGAGQSGASDRLQLSSLAERIRGVFDRAAELHSARVAEVSCRVRAGTYKVDREALGRALASEALG